MNVEDFASMPEAFEGRWYTPQELRRRNKVLAPLGKRICRTHQGHALPLTDDYFHRDWRFEAVYSTECKACHSERIRRTKLERYRSDPEYADRVREQSRQSKRRQPDNHYRRRKQARFKRVLGAQP